MGPPHDSETTLVAGSGFSTQSVTASEPGLSVNPERRSANYFFTSPRPARTPQTTTLNPGDYEQRYPEDESGQEIAEGARVWRVYLHEAERIDTEMVDRWRDSINVLLVFAGVFSAVITAFVVESANGLKLGEIDYVQVNTVLLKELIALQRAAVKGIDLDSIPPAVTNINPAELYTQKDLWVNGLWISSLVCSISAALMATVVRQWMQYYVITASGNPRQQVHIRQLRYDAFQRWGVPTIVGLIPLLLHAAVFLFLWGLFLFFFAFNPPMAWSTVSIGGAVCIFYITSTLLPLFIPECPYRTPVAGWAYQTLVFLRRRWNLLTRRMKRHSVKEELIGESISQIRTSDHNKKESAWPQCQEILLLKDQAHELDVKALMWMATSSNQSVQFIAAQALGGLKGHHEKHAKPTKLSSSGLEDAALRMYQSYAVLSAKTFDRIFRTYCCLSKWRVQWLSDPVSSSQLTSSEKEEASVDTNTMVTRAVDILQQEHAAILAAQERYEAAVSLQNTQENPAGLQKGFDALADLQHDIRVRSKFFSDHISAFGSPEYPDSDLWLLPTLQGPSPFAFLHLFFSVFGPTSPEYQKFMGRLRDGAPGSGRRRERMQAFIRDLNKTEKGTELARTLIQAEPLLRSNSGPRVTKKTSVGEEKQEWEQGGELV